MIIGCTGNYRKTNFLSILNKIYNILSENKIDVYVSDDLLKNKSGINLDKFNFVPFNDLVRKSDVILAIGGDGTILSTVRRLGKNQKPIMGIHIGGLGFLSECVEQNLEKSICEVIKGNYEISERMLLEVSFYEGGKERKIFALNDIVINHGPSARIIKTEVQVSNYYLNTYEGDGLIISTPTGSTAYSLSAGGPIIYPDLALIAVTPICSHSLSARPIVLKSNEQIELKFPNLNDLFTLTIDGQINFELSCKICIKIVKANYNAKLINLFSSEYFDILRNKMGWLGKIR